MTDEADPARRCVLCEREIAKEEDFVVVPRQQSIHRTCYVRALLVEDAGK